MYVKNELLSHMHDDIVFLLNTQVVSVPEALWRKVTHVWYQKSVNLRLTFAPSHLRPVLVKPTSLATSTTRALSSASSSSTAVAVEMITTLRQWRNVKPNAAVAMVRERSQYIAKAVLKFNN